jgi:predicted nucleic acid-binding protein
MCRVHPTQAVWSQAASIHAEAGFHFFDALIVAAAVASGSETLYSEDLHDARRIRGVWIRNPFA